MDEEYFRADGQCRCDLCGTLYNNHEPVVCFSEMGEQLWLRRLCDGTLVKL